MEWSRNELTEAKRQIESTVGKLRKAVESMRGKRDGRRRGPQITLAERRIRAFELALGLIEEELAKSDGEAFGGGAEMVRTARQRPFARGALTRFSAKTAQTGPNRPGSHFSSRGRYSRSSRSSFFGHLSV